MNINEVTRLLNAGFTADEIRAISTDSSDTAKSASSEGETPSQDPAPADAPQETTQAPASAPAQATVNLDPLLSELKELKAIMRAGAIRNGGAPKTEQTAEEVLASIINPPGI